MESTTYFKQTNRQKWWSIFHWRWHLGFKISRWHL